MPIGVLVPDVDNRISAWKEIIERKKKEDEKKEKTGLTVTISREFGCEAYLLAENLKEKLETETGQEWIILDKVLIDKVSKDTNLSKTLVKDLGVKSSFIQDFFSSFQSGSISKDQVFEEIAEIILRMAKVGNVIIIGRGAALITGHLENCLHFRLEAPLDYRINSIASRTELSLDQAKDVVKESQERREEFLKNFVGSDARGSSFYNAIFNNSKASIDTIAKSIFSYIEEKLKK